MLEDQLKTLLSHIPQFDYPFQSRIHRLNSFGQKKCECFVKREDELGFGITGSKVRKYRSLMPFLISHGFEEVLLIGGAYSNHVLGLTQLLIENQMKPVFFLREKVSSSSGNPYLNLLIDEGEIHWVPREAWNRVLDRAQQYVNDSPKKVFLLQEGGWAPASFPGTLSLSLDIRRNEEEAGFSFNHFFIEAGTGLSAISLILGLSWIKHEGTVHVILLAEGEAAFRERLIQLHQTFEKLIGESVSLPTNFKLHLPQTARSFGSTNQKVFAMIRRIARTDPIYSAKLFLEAERILQQDHLEGKHLLIHSGGALALQGYLQSFV
jgi:1-aminocyclopropane-1-carboxylate deaminase